MKVTEILFNDLYNTLTAKLRANRFVRELYTAREKKEESVKQLAYRLALGWNVLHRRYLEIALASFLFVLNALFCHHRVDDIIDCVHLHGKALFWLRLHLLAKRSALSDL